jgi:hypothetical protein
MASVFSPFNVNLSIRNENGKETCIMNEIKAAIITYHLTFRAANEPVS